MRTRVKICGIRTLDDACMAQAAGADFIGLILTESPRRLSREEARRIRERLPEAARPVGVFASEPPDVVIPLAEELRLPIVQVAGWLMHVPHGSIEVWHVLRDAALPDPDALPMVPLRTYLLDASDPSRPGGTGRPSDHAWAARAVRRGLRIIVAGGLDAERVTPVIRDVRPFGVDASSRLESAAGSKDPERVRAFIAKVRALDRSRPRRS